MKLKKRKNESAPNPRSKSNIPFTVISCPRGCGASVKKSIATGDIEDHYRLDIANKGTGERVWCK